MTGFLWSRTISYGLMAGNTLDPAIVKSTSLAPKQKEINAIEARKPYANMVEFGIFLANEDAELRDIMTHMK